MLWLLSCHQNHLIEDQDSTPTIIIIGGGASGLATAKRLVELGLSPLIIEEGDSLGGAGIHAGRFFAVQSSWQEAQNIDDSSIQALSEWETITGQIPDESIEAFIQNSSETLRWLSQNGAYFEQVVSDYGAGSIPRIHTLSQDHPHPLLTWIEILQPYSHTNETVEDIYTSDNHIIVQSDKNQYLADIVVIATGGFSRNTDLVEEFQPALTNVDWSMEAWPNMTGTAIYWFLQNNWPLMNMEHVGLYAHSVLDPIKGFPEVMIVPALQRALIVNRNGERTFNEEMIQSLQLGHLYLNEGPLYAIFDQPLWQGSTMRGLGYNYNPPLELTSTEYATYTTVSSANDIRDLAIELGFRPDTFGSTIAQYNAGFVNNEDPFHKDLSQTFPIQSPPFYAVPIVLSSAKSFGGALLTDQHHVPNHPNIYVVGESAGFLGTEAIGWGFSGSITSCYYFGKTVAETIYSSLESSIE